MSQRIHRRGFLRRAATGGTMLGLGGLSFLSGLPPVSAAEARLAPGTVPLLPDMEPLVRLLEDTPRERLLKVVGARVRRGLSYQQILAALLLAGVRNIQPRPSVGFKFHAVLAVNSVYQAGLSAADVDRWLALFWALDYFKDSQARDMQEGGWRMKPVDEARLPVAPKTQQAFREAMDTWDEEEADAAVARLARTAGSDQVFELLYRYGARDFRSIGHKASGTVKLPWARRWLTSRAKDRRRISWKRLAVWFCSRAMIPTTTSSVWRPWKTITMSRPPGAIAFWRPAYFSCAAREGKTTRWSIGSGPPSRGEAALTSTRVQRIQPSGLSSASNA